MRLQISQRAGDFVPNEQAWLRRFDPTIQANAIAWFCSMSDYRWERDRTAASGHYVNLVKAWDGRVIISQPIAFLQKCAVEQFEDLLRRESFGLSA